MSDKTIHTFHIPVMGLAFTIDTPIRVAHFGISSVISIVDDELIEKMDRFYSNLYRFPFSEISQKIQDYRAKRITSYLNLVDKIVKRKFENFKAEMVENVKTLESFAAMLPSTSALKMKLEALILESFATKDSIRLFLNENLRPGDIDVNIMTKVDKDNYIKNEKLPVEFNDAHAALRGFAKSDLRSSIVLSAGMNPRLFSYFENFPDFFPDESGQTKKKIILKVSDFRSAMIQGNFLAKKGLWVSEYRIESGLNCGGHAFATEGYLLGPILEEFLQKKDQLQVSSFDLMTKALTAKNGFVPTAAPTIKITVQGGVGTASEHEFLLSNYRIDSVGWGSPFLLVPEATSTDDETRRLLANGKESDFYLSNISPLGIPFNTIKGTSNEKHHQKRIADNKPGSSCPKKLLALNLGPDGKGICTASRKYQEIKLAELEAEKGNLDAVALKKRTRKITEKACLCVGLANASYLENHIPVKGQAQGVVICPGPNLAYFDKEISLADMVGHIYGGQSVLGEISRPHMFIKELQLYVNYLANEIQELEDPSVQQQKKWDFFRSNLLDGIGYYKELFLENDFLKNETATATDQLLHCEKRLHELIIPQSRPLNQ